MENEIVKYSTDGHVATITLNNPPANLLTFDLLSALEKVVDSLAKDDQVKALVITGSGSLFVAGADIKEIASISSSEKGESIAKRGQAVLDKIEQMQKPVIAAITGFCLGGGLELAMACHLRIGGERVRLGQPEINLGIIPGFGGTQRLPSLVGKAKAIELILTGDMINAEEGKRIGLFNKVVPEGEVLKQAQGLAKKIASKGKKAVEASLLAIQYGIDHPLPSGLEKEAELFGKVCATEDKKEGVSAFLEKRQAKFQDR
ncbi:MAG: enoyl-CoA hydratase [Nitrospira sp.]